MRSWYIIYDRKEHKCSFVSLNIYKLWMHLNLSGKTFKVTFLDIKEYQEAKRGIETRVNAVTKSQIKPCKLIFK